MLAQRFPAATRSERQPGGELNLPRCPVGSLQRLDAVRRVRIDAALDVERVEGIHVNRSLTRSLIENTLYSDMSAL